ncbi:MAG: GNAT family N-acetyltransferase [Candidatus Marinimicrobia bacterium]|nr:GNAT family N-acetyltransferase [Candidatus Neomarinimicrobiota bacterium]
MKSIPEVLTTQRLVLRPFIPEDKPRFLDFMLDNEATQYLNFTEEQKTVEGAGELFDAILASYETDEPIFSLAIQLKDAEYIGSCGLSPIEDGIWECYYSLNREYWGNGYATEAMSRLKDYAFQEMHIKELRAYMSPENPNSANVAEKIGMQYKGIDVHPVFQNEGLLYSVINPNRQK